MVSKILAFVGLSLFASAPAWADDDHHDHARFPRDATFSTLVLTPLAIEGLTGDDAGNLYTTGRGANPCPVWRISLSGPALVPVGFVPAPCSPSGRAPPSPASRGGFSRRPRAAPSPACEGGLGWGLSRDRLWPPRCDG